ncbi:MAG: LemA family protein [Bdellovibrionaceae bacterium]|nr:LemA family protein [Bdellovibrionales bacterium]MCB9253189.1 LemA family protein [Pseudobdellovibrionaceae bacterium]
MRKVVLLVFVASLALSSGCGYNALQGLDEDVKASWAEVENQYQRRSDLIPNLVSVVKGYAKHEKETLEAVIEARAKATQTKIDVKSLSDAGSFGKFQQAQDSLSSALSRLMVVVERYPDLKANQNFRDLQSQLEGTENRITVARRRYIDAVATYNKKVRYFPTNLTAKYLLGLEVRETFQTTEAAKEAPKVEF